MKKRISLLITLFALAGCKNMSAGDSAYYNYSKASDSEQCITPTGENGYVLAEDQATNNVALTNTTFAYPVVRSNINNGHLYGAKTSVQIEEMLNYFKYDYVNNTQDDLTSFIELTECPWNDEHYLASLFVKAKPAITDNVRNNIVILIDKSGSMTNVFDLVRTSLNTLINNLGNNDRVSIVSYASGTKVEVDGKTGKDKDYLKNSIDKLRPGGSTFGEAGIEKAYELARQYYIEGGNNRVVILTDGDFNVGKVSGEELTKLIKEKASSGIYLTCVGYRSYSNGTMVTLADNGNGNAYYVDGEVEAKKVFEEELGKSLFTVAKDAKCQIQFSDRVDKYHLLGYENRQMSDEEFDDTNKDAGEIMSDHTTVALYEISLKDAYQDDYIIKSTLRYKDPLTSESKEVITYKNDISTSNVAETEFASYVAEYALILSESNFKGNASYEHLLQRINNQYINDKYRDEFVSLINKTSLLK